MSKHTKNEEKSEIEKDSTWDKPNLKGDWFNFYFLILLYTLQGVTSGLSYAFPIILQNTKFVTYNDQVSTILIHMFIDLFRIIIYIMVKINRYTKMKSKTKTIYASYYKKK